MTHSSRRLWVLSVSVVACGAMTGLRAQDDLEALLKDLGGQQKPAAEAAAEKPAEEAKPAAEAAPAAEQPAAAMAEKPVEAAPAPAPVAEAAAEKPAEEAKPAAEAVPAAEQPAAMAEKPAEAAPAPAPVAEAAAEKPAEEAKPAAEAAPAAEQPAAVVAEKPAEAAPAPAPVAEAVPAAQPTEQDKLVSELMTLETIRRKSLDDHGYASLEAARKALRDGDYPLARDNYKQAMEFIGNRPTTVAARDEAAKGMAEAYYLEAKLSMKKGDYEKAMILAGQAREAGHPQAVRLIDTLKKEPAKTTLDSSSISHRVNETTYKDQRDENRRRLRRARQYYTTAEYDKAMEECELVLRDSPYDSDAQTLRDRIADRMKSRADVEFESTRSLMISDVRKSWTASERYAIESAELPSSKKEMTSKQPVSQISGTLSSEQIISQKLRKIVIPEVTFRPPATIIDAIDFFKQASRDYDNPETPVEQRGVNLVLKLPQGAAAAAAPAAPNDPFATPSAGASASGVPVIPAMSARFINLYDALKLVCDVTGMKFRIRGNIVMIVPANEPDEELVTRSYNVLATLQDRLGAAAGELNAASTKSSSDSTFMGTANMDNKQDWRDFFQKMGVQWPQGSSISYMATIGKLRVTNTAEQLAVFEQVLEDLNVTPRLIEIEARFVEVSQKDLNSLGFEWLLNSDYSFNVGGVVDKALGLKEVTPYSVVKGVDADGNPVTTTVGSRTHLTDSSGTPLYDANGNPVYTSGSRLYNTTVNAIDGSTYSTGQRYLSTDSNPIAGEGESINDSFMRVNAFLGTADLSMILHMLSQRTDTDLLSAPKVVTKSGQEAVMKVVTEYIYPTEYDVEISQQGSSGNNSNSSSGMPLATVEPQNFTMREVGVILQVVPEVSAEGQMINLTLNPQVVGEPVWKNYGTKVPYYAPTTSYSLSGLSDAAVQALLGSTANQEVQYMELPMEQPFFNVRSVQTQLSIYNGATVVLGGLITESRKSMDDKVPFLGDIPYLGRLFRSHSELSDKRNLLIFVTARLVDPAGRAVRVNAGEESALMSGAAKPHSAVAPATGAVAGAATPAP